MNKKMVLMALLLVSVAAAVSGTDFEERITEGIAVGQRGGGCFRNRF